MALSHEGAPDFLQKFQPLQHSLEWNAQALGHRFRFLVGGNSEQNVNRGILPGAKILEAIVIAHSGIAFHAAFDLGAEILNALNFFLEEDAGGSK